MITPDEMKAAIPRLREEIREIQKKINLYQLCLKEVAKKERGPCPSEVNKRKRLAALIDYVENGTKPVKACENAGLAKSRWGISEIQRAWRENFFEHYCHIYDTEYTKDQEAGENFTLGTYIKVFPPLITKEIRAKAKAPNSPANSVL
jgi:hypothetical protein